MRRIFLQVLAAIARAGAAQEWTSAADRLTTAQQLDAWKVLN